MALGNVLREFVVRATLKYDDQAFNKFDRGVDKAARTAKKLSFAIAGAATAVFGFAKVSGDNARELDLFSKQTGINTDRLQELAFAAQEAAGVTRDELMGSLEAVSKTLDDVRKGNINAASGFARLGLANEVVADRTLKADQLLAKVADRLRTIKDPIQKAAIAQEVLGGAGAKLIPLLDQGSEGIARLGAEGRKLGAVLDKDMIAKGVEFQKTWFKLWTVIKNISFTIGNELFKALGPVFNEFQKLVLANKEFIATGIAEFVKGLGAFLIQTTKIMFFFGERLRFVVNIFGGWEKVIKAVSVAMAIIFGAKILASIGTMVIALKSVASVLSIIIGLVGGFPALVGGAIIFLIGLFEDLFVFFTGGDSLFGRITGLKPQGIIAFFQGIGQAIYAYMIQPFETFFAMLSKVGNFVSNGLGNIGKQVTSGLSSVGNFLGLSPTNSPTTSNSSTKNEINAPITVTVPPGTSPSQAAGIVSSGVEDGLGALLRQTRNANTGGVAF